MRQLHQFDIIFIFLCVILLTIFNCDEEEPKPSSFKPVKCTEKLRKGYSKEIVFQKWGRVTPDDTYQKTISKNVKIEGVTTRVTEEHIFWYYSKYSKDGRFKCWLEFFEDQLINYSGDYCNLDCIDVTSF